MNYTKTAEKPPLKTKTVFGTNEKAKNSADLESECLSHMAERHFYYEGPIQLTGKDKEVKFAGRECKTGSSKKDDQTEWYKADQNIKSDGRISLQVTYNSHHASLKSSKNHVYFSETSKTLTEREFKAEKARVQKILEERADAANKKEGVRTAKAIRDRKRFEKSSKTGYSPYFERKKVQPYGAKFESAGDETIILVDMRDNDGEIQALQEIYPSKRILPGSEETRDKNFTNAVQGLFHVIGKIENGQPIRVSEGFATSATVYECTGQKIAHVVAFSAGGYLHVIPTLKKLYPKSPITICADNNVQDDPTKRNVGLEEARKVAEKFDCEVVYPIFTAGKERDNVGKLCADFNDLMLMEGAEEVARQVTQPNEKQKKTEKEQLSAASFTAQIELKKLASTLLEKEEPCANFSTKALPKTLSEYIDSLCRQSDAHPIMITTSVISSLSGIIKKKLFMPKGVYFQKLYANLWLLNLYKSGGFKSTAMENGASIAREISKEVIREIKQVEDESRTSRISKDEASSKRLKASLKDVIFPNKITAEGLLKHLGTGHSGVILTGEFGAWLQNMQNGHNTDLKGIFTELYDVPPAYRYTTKNQGDDILEEPFFSICGVSTLTWLKENLNPNDVSSGFFARFLLFTPPNSEDIPPALPRYKQQVNLDAERAIKDILTNMDNEYRYVLSPSATHVFESAHGSLYSMTKSYSEKCQQILDPYLKRWSPYILKLSMIMRLFEDPFSKEISETAINSAMALLIPAIKSTAHLFEGELGESDHQKKCRLIKEWICKRIEKSKPTTWAALITSGILEGGATMYEYPMKTLVEGGLVEEIKKTSKRDWSYMPVAKKVG